MGGVLYLSEMAGIRNAGLRRLGMPVAHGIVDGVGGRADRHAKGYVAVTVDDIIHGIVEVLSAAIVRVSAAPVCCVEVGEEPFAVQALIETIAMCHPCAREEE